VAEYLEATGQHVGERERDVDQRIEQRGLAERPAADRSETIEQRKQARISSPSPRKWPAVSIRVAAGYCACARSE